MSSPFIVSDHTVDCQYIREYPRATKDQEAPLKLLVKKYVPTDNQNPQPGDVTIVAAPGVAIPKECYEPLFEELLARSQRDGFRIRAIWTADAANHGTSGVHNEKHIGNDPSWFDNSRDLLNMINHFRKDMPRPIMGLSHSAGAVEQLYLSLLHPRLLTSLILLEPFLHNGRPITESRWIFARAKQSDKFPSRAAALKKYKWLQLWEPRVRGKFAEHGFRELPTALHPVPAEGDSSEKPVALMTPIAQETMAYSRLNPARHRELNGPPEQDDNSVHGANPPHDPLVVPDMLGGLWKHQVMYRSEPMITWRMLPHVRPSALYVSGEVSALSQDGHQARAVRRTGRGIGGSGGVQYGRVEHAVIKGAGHTAPLEKVADTAAAIGPWIAKEVKRWWEDEKRIEDGWKDATPRDRIGFSDEWVRLNDLKMD
ncbi:Alpha/beta hydrolase family-domain-containing protein [Aspergillus venezuelensis]